MNLFSHHIENPNLESAKNELLQKWKDYCSDIENNPLLVEIQEAQSSDDLNNICCFLRALSILLKDIDPVGRKYDYAAFLEMVTDAVKSNEAKLYGGATSPKDDELIRKYGLDG